MSKYPEHDKLAAGSNQSNICGEFMEWLTEQGIHLTTYHETRYFCAECGEIPKSEARGNGMYSDSNAWGHHRNNERCDGDVEYNPEGFYPVTRSIEDILAERFDIDMKKIDQEKRAMLDECRELNVS